MRLSALLVCFIAVACTDDIVYAPIPDASSTDDAGRTCIGSAVTKGPWVLAVDATHATIRWETCRGGTSGEVNVVPQLDPANAWVAHAIEAEYDLTQTHLAVLNPAAVPDYPGAWFMHDAKLVALAPSTCYDYTLAGDPRRGGHFCTQQPASSPKLRFLAIGDTNPGLGPTVSNLLGVLLPMKPKWTMHLGDIEYYDSGLDTWQYWADVMQPLLSSGAFVPAIGNHESETPDEFDNYTLRFFRGAGFDGTDEYYEIEDAGVHFYMLDTELPLDASSPQLDWFTQRITAAEQEPGYRFSIVGFHKPFVTCGDTGDNPTARALFEPLFLAHKVPLVLQAHMHGYERFDFGNITYVTTGGGGGALGDVNKNMANPYCDKRVASGRFFHGTIIDINTSIQGTVVDDHGVTQDTFDLALP